VIHRGENSAPSRRRRERGGARFFRQAVIKTIWNLHSRVTAHPASREGKRAHPPSRRPDKPLINSRGTFAVSARALLFLLVCRASSRVEFYVIRLRQMVADRSRSSDLLPPFTRTDRGKNRKNRRLNSRTDSRESLAKLCSSWDRIEFISGRVSESLFTAAREPSVAHKAIYDSRSGARFQPRFVKITKLARRAICHSGLLFGGPMRRRL